MVTYSYRGKYSAAAWQTLTSNPVNLMDVIGPSIEKFAGRPVACFLIALSHEALGFVEFPDDITASAWGMSLIRGEFVANVEMTKVLTLEEAKTAMQLVKDSTR